MWVLLKFYNEYDQHGGYFAGVFEDLEKAEKAVDHLGRKGCEHSWYEVREVKLNKFDQSIEVVLR